jgi:formate dehydrogenase subunit gamma
MTHRRELVRAIAESHRDERGALMPVLHDVNDELGWISPEDVAEVADVLNLSRADVHGVVSFYDDFRTSAPPAHSLRLCRAEACQSVGAEDLFASETVRAITAAGDVDQRQVFCLGNCALGPSGLVDGALHGRLTPKRLVELTAGWRA